MFRRWFIRICFMLPILVCVGGWGWSSTHVTGVAYGNGHAGVAFGTGAGTLRIVWIGGLATPGWRLINEPLNPPEFWPAKSASDDPQFLGFYYRYFKQSPDLHFYFFFVPYWALIVVCGGVFAWVWRKTGKPKPGRAFPVELAAKGKEA